VERGNVMTLDFIIRKDHFNDKVTIKIQLNIKKSKHNFSLPKYKSSCRLNCRIVNLEKNECELLCNFYRFIMRL